MPVGTRKTFKIFSRTTKQAAENNIIPHANQPTTLQTTMEKKRIAYLDFIKILAMFIVTIEHCAQSLSIQMFPEKIIPNDFFIATHMPLFMIASGFVLNFDKIRATPLKEYIHNRNHLVLEEYPNNYTLYDFA